jgi:hypothetical protein
VFNRGVRCTATAAALLTLAVALAGCGGGDSKKQASAPTQTQTTAAVTTVATARTTTAERTTTTTRHTASRRVPSSSAPLRVAAPYTCNGKALRAIAADGPVKVDPAIVKPGQTFRVTVTDRRVKVADVSLTGVSSTAITAHAVGADEGMAARLKMPRGASCGNKLLEVEGDLSAEAYVGVSG